MRLYFVTIKRLWTKNARRPMRFASHFFVHRIFQWKTGSGTQSISSTLIRIPGRSCPVSRVLSSWPEDPSSRLAWRKLPCTLMAPGACKIRPGGNVLQAPIQIILLGVPKRRSHPLHGRSKLWWHVTGQCLGMSARPSAIGHCVAVRR